MEVVDTIRAWKDEDYRLSLEPQQRAKVPDHPAGNIEVPDVEVADSFTCSSTLTFCNPF